MTVGGEDERAGREATQWLIALREEPEDRELRARFDAWLAADPAHRAAWQETGHLLDLVSRVRRASPVAGARLAPPADPPANLVADMIAERQRRRRPRRLLVAGLAAAAACLLLVLTGPGLLLRLQASHMSATAEIRTLRLEDGSTVRLAAESAIDVAFAPGMRQVRLLRGEAFFEVVRDAARPFTVVSGDVLTTVLGTAFEVHRAGDATEVTVREGVVQVSTIAATPPISERLVAGDHLRVGPDGEVGRATRAPDEIAAWLRGTIVASDRTVADVVDELARYSSVAIIVADGTLARARVTGVYNLADPSAAARAVASAHGAKVRQISPWLIVLSSY